MKFQGNYLVKPNFYIELHQYIYIIDVQEVNPAFLSVNEPV